METLYRPTFLIMITAANNNKYYRMLPKDDGTFDVEYGRVGASCQHSNYPVSQWDKKYREKVRKGYVDQTDLMTDLVHEEKKKGSKDVKDIENKVIAQIVERLQDMANKTIQKNYRVESVAVTQAMVDKAQDHIDKMANRGDQYTLREFNDDLVKLFGIIPRKMSEVSDYLAGDKSEFSKILSREQDLLDVMKGQVVQHSVTAAYEDEEESSIPDKTILEAMDLVFEECSASDIDHIKELMGENAGRLKNAWKVTNLKTQKRFDDFVKKEGIKDIREFWHGSGNANWWSIIGNGLYLRPTNVKMLQRVLRTHPEVPIVTIMSRLDLWQSCRLHMGNHTISMNLIPSIMTLTGNICRISVQERIVYMHTKAWIQDGADYEMMRSSCTKKNRQRSNT